MQQPETGTAHSHSVSAPPGSYDAVFLPAYPPQGAAMPQKDGLMFQGPGSQSRGNTLHYENLAVEMDAHFTFKCLN